MLKSIFLLIATVILFTGCHRFHHGLIIASPAVILSPFHIKSYHHGYTRGHGHYNRAYYRHRRGL